MLIPAPHTAAMQDWLPVKLQRPPGETPFCEWMLTGPGGFAEPFFDETISKWKLLDANHQRYRPASSLDLLDAWAAPRPAVPPTAFIFHVSRCGSTLLSQMLSRLPQHIILSEAPFLDDLLRLPLQHPQFTTTQSAQWLQAALQWYGQQRNGSETALFVKTDSWHIFFYHLLRKLYPQTPFILLYRSPAEVLRSQQRKRGMHALPGFIEPALFGIEEARIRWHDFDHWLCMVLEKYFTAFTHIAATDPLALPVSYHEGMTAALRRIAGFCGLEFTAAEWEAMEERSLYHGKFPGQRFEEPAATDPLPAELEPAMQLFAQLEKNRVVAVQ